MNLRYKIMQFMSGRYGIDKLFYGLFVIAFILSFTNIFIRSLAVQLIVYGFVFLAFFRMFSRNTSKRSQENRKFENMLGFLKRKREFERQKRADKLHVYKTCKRCRAILRLPHRVGVHKTVCPKCGNEFTVKVKK